VRVWIVGRHPAIICNVPFSHELILLERARRAFLQLAVVEDVQEGNAHDAEAAGHLAGWRPR